MTSDGKTLDKKNSENTKNKSSDDALPTTSEELGKWLAKTEWIIETDNAGIELRRFYPENKTTALIGQNKWNAPPPNKFRNYKILSERSISYGAGWIVVFDKKFKSFKATLKNGNRTKETEGKR